jgi:hypothetical protein
MQKNPRANLHGMLKLIKASKNPLTPVFESLANSLESIIERKSSQQELIEIEFHFNDQDDDAKRLDFITITDSGAGFNTQSYSRFNELLNTSKGYRNRGSGRLQYFHRFSEMLVESNYKELNNWKTRKFKCNRENFIYADTCEDTDDEIFKTIITLQGLRSNKQDDAFFSSLTLSNFSSVIKTQFALRAYLENQKEGMIFPLIRIKFSYQISQDDDCIEITNSEFPAPTAEGEFEVNRQIPYQSKNGDIAWEKVAEQKPEKFNWLVFEFDADQIESHGAFLCSKDIPVEHLKNPILQSTNGFKGKKKVAAFYGDYLDNPENVNDSVDSFNIKSRNDVKDITGSLLDNEGYVYLDDIKKQANSELKFIYDEIAQAQKEIEKSVFALAKELGISAHIAKIANKIIGLNDDDDSITRILHIAEAKYVAERSNKARKVINQLNELDPTADNYQKDIEEKSKELSSLLDEQNKEELSKYVVRRELVAKLLDRILDESLDVQNKELPKGKNRDREGLIHDLIFKRKMSGGVNDLWILNEEFVHFDGFSELELSKMTLPDGNDLLDKDQYDEMKVLGFKPNKRPDIFLFAGEGKCIIIEFKEPKTDLSNYLQQMPKYCNLLANYSSVPIENFYCYLIGEAIEPEADLNEYEESVMGCWYRDSIPVRKVGGTREKIASMRIEIIKLSDIGKRAHKRNFNFASKLGLDLVLEEADDMSSSQI